jgi:toxin YoeB
MKKIWEERAWDEYIYWQQQDKKTLKKVNQLLKDIDRNGYKGLGKPEALSGDLAGFWSRRIDDANRIVYRIKEEKVEIAQCKGHYDDK